MVERGKRTLKAKLLQIIVSTMMLTGVVTMGAFAWTNYTLERSRRLEIETQIREAISGKAATLAASHALALRGPAQDNAFGDVRQVVASAVNQDTDLIYGLFLSAAGETWAYVSPSHPDVQPSDPQPVNAAAELGIRTDASSPALSHRTLRMFGQQILEWSANVVGEDGERLGTIIYGFSNERTHAAVLAAERRSQGALLRAFITCTAIALLSLVFGIVWMSRSAARITDPLAELTAAANKIATGQRGLRVKIKSGDEVQDLAAAFNQMLEANEDAMRKLEVTTERALAADRLKSEFLANMSHEIRTPMNGVLGMVKLMRTMRLDGKLRRYVDTIDSAANSLLTIIDDVLDFSKMEAGKYTIVSVPFQPHLVVQEVAELLASRAHEKHLAFIHRTSTDLPEVVVGDPDRFRQVLNNLVGNAIKFTERGEVFIEVDVAERTEETVLVRVAVHDTGIGIDPKDIPKLYDAFSQVDGTAVRRYGGTGLGLAISKRLVNMMGGDIEARSTPGQGSVFTFTARFGVSDASVASNAGAHRSLRVLVADGNRRWRDVILEHLGAWEMHGESRETAEEALTALKQAELRGAPFDAAVLSAELVGMSAAEMVRAVRAEPALRALPLILLSSAPLSGMDLEIQAELTAQLQKPLRFSDLYDALTGKLSAKVPIQDPRESVAPMPLPVSTKHVLVVDDNEINRFVVVEELSRRGYVTEEATNGQEAVEKFRRGDYLCVLMDCQMPVLDGYEATRAIRKIEADEQRPRTPVIALTAHALVGERERVLAVGMDDFLSKPFRPTSLEKLLRLHTRESNNKLLHAAEPAAVRPHLDLAVKRSEKLIRLFLANIPAQLDRLEEAIQAADQPSIRALAHKIKGSCLALAAEAMSKTAEVLQHRAEASDLGECERQMAELRRQHAVVTSLLAKELADHQRGSLETAKA